MDTMAYAGKVTQTAQNTLTLQQVNSANKRTSSHNKLKARN